MTGFFGDDDDDESQSFRPVPLPPPVAPRPGPSSERLDSPAHRSPSPAAVNGNATRRRGQSVEMDMGLLDADEEVQEDEEDGALNETLVARLTRRWVDEREAPEILPPAEDDVEECLTLMRMQSNAIASIRKVETDISEEEHFRFILVQQDMERVKYIVKNYTRARQYKIERFSQYMLKLPTELVKLTDAERTYLQNYHRLLSAHIQRSVLDSLPDSLQQVDRAGMCALRLWPNGTIAEFLAVAEPDLNKAVHFYVRRECGPVRLPGCVRSVNK